MYEPSPPPSPETPPLAPVAPAPPPGEGRALRLLGEVRAAQARALRTQGLLLAVVVFLVSLVGGAWVANTGPRLGLALICLGVGAALVVLAVFGLLLPRRRVGDDARTARTLAAQVPELNLDLLAAVELSKALGTREDFSPELARAFLRDVDAKASRLTVDKLLDPRPTQRAAMALVATVFVLLGLVVFKGAALRDGLALALTPAELAEPLRRTPITGDVELTYRYPVHTGLEVRTIPSSTGDVSAPAGTEVTLRTRADRDVDAAALIMTPGGQRVPLRVERRELTGSFVLTESGQYHVAFLDGDDLVAEGPDQSITVEADQPPQARITAPIDGLELDPSKQAVTLRFEASDDYGLSTLDLVFTPDGSEARRVSLKPDDGRTTRGTYQWDLGGLALRPGQGVSYYLEATDNDAVKGPKKGASAVLRLKLYSSAEHRREALAKAEALWGRLVDHLADRMESPDRPSPSPIDAAVAGKPIDERGTVLAADITALTQSIAEDRDPSEELLSTLQNVGAELTQDVSQVSAQRRVLLRISGREGGPDAKNQFVDTRNGSFTLDLSRRLSAAIGTDIQHAEKNVLYLEALLDRAKLEAIRELAKQLREDRKELSRLVEEFSRTPDAVTQQALLQQMDALKQRMLELQQRMAELSKGIRDDFMNAEALQQMQEEFGLQSALDQVEQLVQRGQGRRGAQEDAGAGHGARRLPREARRGRRAV